MKTHKNLNFSIYVIPGLIRNPLFLGRCRFRVKPGMTLLGWNDLTVPETLAGTFYDAIKYENS
jgi:hypothetical protein